jgi:hypothetical protein
MNLAASLVYPASDREPIVGNPEVGNGRNFRVRQPDPTDVFSIASFTY